MYWFTRITVTALAVLMLSGALGCLCYAWQTRSLSVAALGLALVVTGTREALMAWKLASNKDMLFDGLR